MRRTCRAGCALRLVQRARLFASAGYFRNRLEDFIGNAFADPVFVPADPARGLHPLSPFFPFHGVLYVQRTNTARARIQGYEASYEARLSLRGRGTLTPFEDDQLERAIEIVLAELDANPRTVSPRPAPALRAASKR